MWLLSFCSSSMQHMIMYIRYKILTCFCVVILSIFLRMICMTLLSFILLFVFYHSTTADIYAQNIDRRGCGHDYFEPNNQRAKAKNISTQFKHNRVIEAHVCQYDIDWFSFWLDKGQLVEVTLHSTQARLMPAIHVFAPRKRKPSGILRRNKHEQKLKIYAKRSGRYRLKVAGYETMTERYILKMKVLP